MISEINTNRPTINMILIKPAHAQVLSPDLPARSILAAKKFMSWLEMSAPAKFGHQSL
jgi:hypothetical protein